MIERYNDNLKEKWDKCVKESVNGTFMLSRDFINYHPEGKFTDNSVIIDDKFVFSANENNGNIYSHQGLSYAGLLSPKGTKLTSYLKVFYKLLNYYKELGFKELIYKQVPSIYCQEHNGSEDYALFLSGAHCYRKETNVVVDLNKKTEFSERKKRNIKKGFDNNLFVKIGNDDKDYEEYWNKILTPCLKNKHNVAPVHSLEEIIKLKNLFLANIYLDTVYYKDEMVGGAVWFESGKVSHSQYIANNNICLDVCGLDYLFSHFMAHNHGRLLSFGVCTENEGKVLNKGLVNWKSEFGGEIVTHNFYKIDLQQDFETLKDNV